MVLSDCDYDFASCLIPLSRPIPPIARKVVPLCVELLPCACRFPAAAAHHSPPEDRPARRGLQKVPTPLVPGCLRCWQIPALPGKKGFACLRSLARGGHYHSSDRSNPPGVFRLDLALYWTPCLTMCLASRLVFSATHPTVNNPRSARRHHVHPAPAQSSTRDPASTGRASPAATLL